MLLETVESFRPQFLVDVLLAGSLEVLLDKIFSKISVRG
jgi:hypothetical protein